jgi:hemerythrin-like domain-containing protein
MRTTEILMSEHRVIETVLACLDKMADASFDGGTVPVADARAAIEFLRTFADGCHHKKEEDRLFPAMERYGLPREAGPTAVMREEHVIGRERVAKMAAAVDAFEKGGAGASDTFALETRLFVDHLREHIAKEDQVLFPMADRMLPPAEEAAVLAGFEHAERHEVGEGTHEKFLGVARDLAVRWRVTTADAAAKAHTCGCSHSAPPRGTRLPGVAG